MLISVRRNVGQNRNVKTANRPFENVAKFRHIGTTLRNQNFLLGRSGWNLKSGNACYHFVQNLLCPRLLSKSVHIKIHETIIPPVVLCGCENLVCHIKGQTWTDGD
jgi:hypothetical protein